jgi:hypothetical protein
MVEKRKVFSIILDQISEGSNVVAGIEICDMDKYEKESVRQISLVNVPDDYMGGMSELLESALELEIRSLASGINSMLKEDA